jgi:hypothetical protein
MAAIGQSSEVHSLRAFASGDGEPGAEAAKAAEAAAPPADRPRDDDAGPADPERVNPRPG